MSFYITHALLIWTWFLRNQFWRTWVFVYFKLDFYCLVRLKKRSLKYVDKKSSLSTLFFKLDFSKIKCRSTQQYFWTKSANCLRYFLKKMPHHMTIVYDLEEVNPQRQWTSAKEGRKERGKKERTLENEDIKCVDALILSW